ncbi:MAG: hypothetical protein LLG37_07035, partial [Spirochaetia bacterium]|nr:hypothetical protein [Spirochaetia bacterium]
MNFIIREIIRLSCVAVMLINFLCVPLFATTFQETFSTETYKDTVNTTANWDTVNGRANLTRVNKFSETTGVINWGGGVTCIDYDPSSSKWLFGGEYGKINVYDGTYFTNLSLKLRNWGTSTIRSVKSNGSIWLIGGDGTKLNSWDGSSTWTDLSLYLSGFGDVRAIGYKGGTPAYWLIGGTSASLNKYDGTDFTSLKTDLSDTAKGNFGTNNVNALGWNGSYWLIAGTGGRICKFDGSSSWTDLSGALAAAGVWNGSYDINTIEWNGSVWLIGGGSDKLATYNGSAFTNRSTGYSFTTVWSVKWNGSYWLIGGMDGSSTRLVTTADFATYYQQTNPAYFTADPVWAIGATSSGTSLIGGRNGRMMKRSGSVSSPVNTNLGNSIKDFGALNIKCAAWNGSYWLIGGIDGSLNKYNGTTYTDVRDTLGWGSEDVLSIGWNSTGGYWLIGGTNGYLARYDGTTMTDRTSALGWGTGNSVMAIKWANNQWVIGGENRHLAKSGDGTSFTTVDISSYFVNSTDAVLAVEWAGGTIARWYIGGESGCIVEYDGISTFGDLRPPLRSKLGAYYNMNAIKWNGGTKIRMGLDSAKLIDYQSG